MHVYRARIFFLHKAHLSPCYLLFVISVAALVASAKLTIVDQCNRSEALLGATPLVGSSSSSRVSSASM